MPKLSLDQRAGLLVQREVLVCVSSLVSTLSGASGDLSRHGEQADRELYSLADQAAELSYPVPDYESAAREAGWSGPNAQAWYVNADGRKRHEPNGWEALCRNAASSDGAEIEPHDREVYEHWAVTSWLAEQLEAQSERVDTDFAGLNVWARTTTGQQISADCVIERIVQATGYAGGGEA